jgi:hypothetical protein
MSQVMDDQDLPTGPSDRDKLRDRIFQQRLWIEELRRTADKNTVGRAIADLEHMTEQVQKIKERRSRKSEIMATRDYRLAEFNQGPPPPNQSLQLLCEDHNGTYLLPFRCEWRDGAWYRVENTKPLEAKVVGWRTWRS